MTHIFLIPLLEEQRVLGGPYIVGTTDDRTFFLLWTRVIRLPYLATYEPSNPMCMRRARVLPTQAAFRVICHLALL